jgi:hypothetical protein
MKRGTPLPVMIPKLPDASFAKVQPMEREILLRRPAQAEQSVAEGKALIAQQQRLIVESERDGEDAAETIRVLEKFLMLHQAREQDRARILDELSDSS